MWTQFWDMNSGGSQKLPWKNIFIEADDIRACELFEKFFGQSPTETACECCGENYSISHADTLALATAYHRNCAWEGDNYVERPRDGLKYLTTLEYVHRPEVLVIHADELEGFDAALAKQRALTAHLPTRVTP